jgi:hypothetical protein
MRLTSGPDAKQSERAAFRRRQEAFMALWGSRQPFAAADAVASFCTLCPKPSMHKVQNGIAITMPNTQSDDQR